MCTIFRIQVTKNVRQEGLNYYDIYERIKKTSPEINVFYSVFVFVTELIAGRPPLCACACSWSESVLKKEVKGKSRGKVWRTLQSKA